jgi:hypothetical protein
MALFFALSGFAQENMTRVEDSALKHPMRPLALFAHDAHNEKAGIEECAVCHHVYKNGKKVEGSSSEGVACSECHMGRKGDIMPLVRAYHARCKGCHEEKKVGPVMCAECHQKEKKL